MFVRSLETFAAEDQQHWVKMSQNLDIAGCYAQTELGHGSNVGGLETTAIFDRKTDTFVINTPTITSTKFWPGELGRISNFALVFAQLIIPDENGGESNRYGVMPFILQIRDRDTHKHMPGIKTGDIGPKLGYSSKDNGWMTIDNVRIPRDQMLQRFIKVDRDGSVSMQGDQRVLYSTMMLIRVSILVQSKLYLAKALTIALRYSVVRRQFKNISGQKEETRLIDYQTQQQKLFPMVAMMFAHSYASENVTQLHKRLLEDISKSKFDLLEVVHHYSSGMKSLFTDQCYYSLIAIRQCLGGAGYSAWSGIPELVADYSP